MILWPFTGTKMSGNENYISESVFIIFGKVCWVLCGTDLFVYFYLCLISVMTECQKYCEAGSVVYDMEEKAHLRITDKIEKIFHPWTFWIVQQTFPPQSTRVCLSLPKPGSSSCVLLLQLLSLLLPFAVIRHLSICYECSCNGTRRVLSSVLTTLL